MQLAAADGTVLPAPVPLSDHERQMNLEALKFIAGDRHARLHFQLESGRTRTSDRQPACVSQHRRADQGDARGYCRDRWRCC